MAKNQITFNVASSWDVPFHRYSAYIMVLPLYPFVPLSHFGIILCVWITEYKTGSMHNYDVHDQICGIYYVNLPSHIFHFTTI